MAKCLNKANKLKYMKASKRRLIIIVGTIALLAVCAEVAMRLIWGFCDSPLSVESDKFEYICAPNQECHRFGHYIKYNSYSQRSDEPDSSKIIVLGLGDSVINGGAVTDNDSLATSLASNDSVQILNISAGSWGPDNCAAYLKQYGTFNAAKILLVVGSGDAYDNMDFQKVVGVHKSYPKTQYKLAIWELIDRYLIPRIIKPTMLDPDQKALQGVGIHKKGTMFNPGFSQIKAMADSLHIKMAIYLHPDQKEFSDKKYDEQGNDIIQWARANGVELTKGMYMPGFNKECYRDGIHINAKGQKVLAEWMKAETKNL